MKKIFCLLVVCLTLFVGCDISNLSSDELDQVMVYDGEFYDFYSWSNWNLINKEAEWETIYVGFSDESKVNETIKYTTKAKILKDDPNRRIIAYGVVETNYYIKRGTIIPDIYSDHVEKVVLSNDILSVKLEKDDLVLWQDFLKQCYSDKKSHNFEKWSKGVPDSSIYVYFYDFPMNYYYGYFGVSESGKLGFSSWDFEDYNTHCIIIPEDLSNRILSLGYKN